MKKLIVTAILAAILPAYLASGAGDKNDNGNPPDGKPKQGQGGKCHGKDGNGRPGKQGKPGPGGPPKNQ